MVIDAANCNVTFIMKSGVDQNMLFDALTYLQLSMTYTTSLMVILDSAILVDSMILVIPEGGVTNTLC